VQPFTSGNDLRARAVAPGPIYRTLLTKLRAARLDGEVNTAAEERTLLEKLLAD
jgi:tRNA nucleotidyltransferase (CCA-adding enzyme)